MIYYLNMIYYHFEIPIPLYWLFSAILSTYLTLLLYENIISKLEYYYLEHIHKPLLYQINSLYYS